MPADLDGTFYRVGPDFQYPPRLPNIPFDGEGHIGMFRFANGHVDYKSRFVRTQRYKAQAEAREVAVRHVSQPAHATMRASRA